MKGHILIAEDDYEIAMAIREYLSAKGYYLKGTPKMEIKK